MRVLGIESSTPAQGVALVEDDRLVAEASYLGEGARGGRLLPTLDDVLRKAGIAPKDLHAVAVSIGPGSFTGLRVGLATAKGLVLGTGVALVGVPSLEVLAEAYSVSDVTICALLDAYRGEVYMALFRRRGGCLERLSDDSVLTPEAVAATVDGAAHVIGNGAVRYRERLAAAFRGRAVLTEEGLQAVPSAVAVARLGMRQLAGGTETTPNQRMNADVSPIYLRRAEAEVNWEKGLVKPPLSKVTG